MPYIESHKFHADSDALAVLLTEARNDERKDRALAVSIRLQALVIHITQKEMGSKEIVELIRREAVRYENESQELH